MIVYFSATGNTRFVARQLAKLLDDTVLDLGPRMRVNDFSEIRCEKTLVVCSPVHVSGLPKFIADYLRKAEFTGVSEAYGILTDAGYCGIAGTQLSSVLRAKGMDFKGFAEFKLPGIHITSITNRKIDVDEIEGRIAAASEQIPSVADAIRRGELLESKGARASEVALTVGLSPALRFIGLRTKRFWATERCTSCGLCEKICPVAAITMRSGKPTWNVSHCAHCMACIHNCPTEAIEYGKITQGKKRYTFSKYRYAAKDDKAGA
jgi:ferredoxin/flavodoxin